MPDVSIEDLVVEYPTPDYVVRPLDGFTRQLGDGTLTLVLGPSGCGKTTLLSCLGGLLRPTSGRIVVGDTDVSALDDAGLVQHRRERVGFVFQSFNLLASLDARQNVAAPLLSCGRRRREAFLRADFALREVGMSEFARKRPAQLSGGQQQRVAVARGVVNDPEILLADEPTANLDYVQAEGVIEVLRALARPGRIVIVASHDDRLLPIADDVIELAPKVVDEAPAAERVHLAAGEILFAEGDRGSLVYEVLEGTVELVQGRGPSERIVTTAGRGVYFGELGVMMAQPRTATARAATDAVLRAMTLPEFRVRGRGAANDAAGRARRNGAGQRASDAERPCAAAEPAGAQLTPSCSLA